MQTTVTLVHKNCRLDCNLCSYGRVDPVGYERIGAIVDQLHRKGYRVKLFDFDVNSHSLEIFKKTRQYEGERREWLNVNPGFDPSPEEVAYLNGLNVNIVISLHGATPEMQRLTSGLDDFKHIERFLRRYHQRLTPPLGISCVVSRRNLDHLEDFVEWCTRFDLAFVELLALGYSGNATERMGVDAVLTDEDRYRVAQLCDRYRGTLPFKLKMDSMWGPDFERDPKDYCNFFAPQVENEFCNAGINHFGIRLNDLTVFPCPCMAGVESMTCGHFDGEDLVIEDNWILRKEGRGEPCSSCDQFAGCGGGCRLPAASNHMVQLGRDNRQAGFKGCLHDVKRRLGRTSLPIVTAG